MLALSARARLPSALLHQLGWTIPYGLAIALASAGACAGRAPVESGPSGVWVMSLGRRPFMVLTLSGAAGTVSHPKSFSLNDSSRFTGITLPVVTQPLSHVVVNESHVHFVIENPTDPADTDEYDLALTDADHATLTYVGLPFKTDWRFTRVRTVPVPAVATDWEQSRAYTAEEEVETDSGEMATLFTQDQQPRQREAITAAEWRVIAKDDAERRRRTRALVDAGQLHTGEDFRKAAFIFQHGDGPNDYLMAHTLALIAASKGNAEAAWIGAATLDRYLQSIGRPQIYGTQFRTPEGKPATQAPYDRTLMTDALRAALGVPRMASQQTQLDEMNAPRPAQAPR
jgi:hypothetical protein